MKRTFFFISFLLFAKVSFATTYYVNKAGSNANSCATAQSATDANAKLTVNGATGGTSCLSSGDTLIIGDGTYVEQLGAGNGGGATAIPAGSMGAPTIIQAENRNLAIMMPNIPSGFYACEIMDRSYITIDGMVCDTTNIQSSAYYIHAESGDTNYIIIKNGTARNGHGGSSDGVTLAIFAGASATSLHDNQILNMDVYDNGQPGPPTCLVPGCGAGIYNRGSSSIIDGNRSHDNGQLGIQNDNASTLDADSNIYRNNVVYGNGNGCFFVGNGDLNAVYNNVCYNNSVIDEHAAIDVHHNTNYVYSNTIYNNIGYCVSLLAGSTHIVQNNICYQNDNDSVELSGGTGTVSKNLLGTDPIFTDAAGGNFILTSVSPAIDYGATLGAPYNSDILGVTRPLNGGYDAGAYEVNGTAPPPSTVPRDDFDDYVLASDLDTLNGGTGWATPWMKISGGAMTIAAAPMGGGNVAQSSSATAGTRYDRTFTQSTTECSASNFYCTRFTMTNTASTLNDVSGIVLREGIISIIIIEFLGTDIYLTNGGSYDMVPFTANTEYTIDAEWDPATDMWHYRINGGSFSSLLAVPTAFAAIDKIRIEDEATNAHSLYIDDIGGTPANAFPYPNIFASPVIR